MTPKFCDIDFKHDYCSETAAYLNNLGDTRWFRGSLVWESTHYFVLYLGTLWDLIVINSFLYSWTNYSVRKYLNKQSSQSSIFAILMLCQAQADKVSKTIDSYLGESWLYRL